MSISGGWPPLAIDTLDLGRGTGTDFLSVSFSTLDLVGHQYGPASHEVAGRAVPARSHDRRAARPS